ncbi:MULTISPECIES: 50S ribosomal protein L10 [unclassified Adlercreutzia]|uniref:50S ribosomal protein L10 n=1 Tax=unclassified Adlercreutzia TaxID=2636013 RepID=UPI0013EA6973|nr:MULTISPECIES: 50S ribosomal protein L10 [unclassified Adlercreutzia]
MPNLKNQETLEKIKGDLDGVNAMWVVDYRGLSVKEIEALRGTIREADARMKVYKNTLMHIALEELELPNLDVVLEGPSAFVFSGNDVAASAKAIKEFAKTNPNLVIKGGMMDGAFVDADQVEAIASLPSREQLLAQIAGAISGVARGLAVCVNGVPSGLARAIKAVSEQKPAA